MCTAKERLWNFCLQGEFLKSRNAQYTFDQSLIFNNLNCQVKRFKLLVFCKTFAERFHNLPSAVPACVNLSCLMSSNNPPQKKKSTKVRCFKFKKGIAFKNGSSFVICVKKVNKQECNFFHLSPTSEKLSSKVSKDLLRSKLPGNARNSAGPKILLFTPYKKRK